MAAAVALVPVMALDETVAVVAALGTDKAVGPAHREHGLPAWLLGAIPFQKGGQAEALLERDRILGYG